MGIFSNLLGTLSSTFQIGKKGITISQGGFPLFPKNGDVHITSGATPKISQYRDGWEEIGVGKKFVGTFTGNDIDNTFTVNHSLGTRDAIVSVRENFGEYRDVMVAVSRPDVNTIVIHADDAIPSSLTYTITVIA